MTKEKEIRIFYKDLTAPGIVMLAFWGAKNCCASVRLFDREDKWLSES
jgi:hypothetical protein